MKLFKTKKGSILDLLFIVVGLLGMAIIAILITFLLTKINDHVQTNIIFSTAARTASTTMTNGFPATMNFGIIFVFICLSLISCVLAALIPVHPIFLVFYIIEYVVVVWISAAISNTYQMFIESATLVDIAPSFMFVTFLFHYMPFFIALIGIILASVMYKVKGEFWAYG